MKQVCLIQMEFDFLGEFRGKNYMEMVSGWQVFSKEEMNNENAIKVFSDMIQNFDNDIPKWKEDCGMRKLLEC